MKKAMAAMMAATMMAGSLAGCGNNSSEEQGNEKAGGENELRIMMSSGDFGADTIKPSLEKAQDV